ncbi:MAG: DUF1326 domain-containing protein [Chloroflexota bacterium]|nr:DUF1326 domain-containing protein [Chloroflexota bacterium]
MAWRMKGTWYETCASQGQCAYYFGRDREEPCTSFHLFEIKEGEIDGVDVSGILVMAIADSLGPRFADLLGQGGDGGIYITDRATEEQRKALEPFFVNNVPGWLLTRKVLGVRFVPISLSKEDNTHHITMPHGEIKMTPTAGLDGNPVRVENCLFNTVFSQINVCNCHYWKYRDFGKDFDFQNRASVMCDFDMQGG